MSTSELSAVIPLHLVAGNLGLPGAPILNLAVLYNSDPIDATLSGEAVITQAVPPPYGRIAVHGVHGPVHGLGLGGATRVFTLTGQYFQSFPPPAIGVMEQHFTATFVTDNNWQGHGTFTYGGHVVANVPIKQLG